MSADRWNICPKCKALAEANKLRLEAKAQASYGKVSREAYARLVAEAAKPLADPSETFREDFWVGLDGGGEVVKVDYSGSCRECGFEVSFKHEQPTSLKK